MIKLIIIQPPYSGLRVFMKLISLCTTVLLCSLWSLPALCSSEAKAPESLVIIETLTPDQEGGVQSTFCPGFMLTEYDLITAYRCASAAPENIRVYRSIADCNARNNSVSIESSAQRDSPNEPTTVALNHPMSRDMVAMKQFPYLDLNEPLNCYFLTELDNKIVLNWRRAFYYDAVRKGIFKIMTLSLPSPNFSGEPIPGAILFNQIGFVTGVSFDNNHLFSPETRIIHFHIVAPDNRGFL